MVLDLLVAGSRDTAAGGGQVSVAARGTSFMWPRGGWGPAPTNRRPPSPWRHTLLCVFCVPILNIYLIGFLLNSLNTKLICVSPPSTACHQTPSLNPPLKPTQNERSFRALSWIQNIYKMNFNSNLDKDFLKTFQAKRVLVEACLSLRASEWYPLTKLRWTGKIREGVTAVTKHFNRF